MENENNLNNDNLEEVENFPEEENLRWFLVSFVLKGHSRVNTSVTLNNSIGISCAGMLPSKKELGDSIHQIKVKEGFIADRPSEIVIMGFSQFKDKEEFDHFFRE